MTGRERVMTVINGGIPDRVPITLHNFQMAVERTGRRYDEVLKSGELLAEAMLSEWREFKHDLILLEIGTACSAEAMGAEVEYDVDRSAVSHGPAIESLDEVDTLVIPENFDDKPPWKVTLDAVRILRKELGDDAAICGRADQGPFSLASMLRGMEDFMMDIGDPDVDDRKIHRLMEICEEVVFRYAQAMQQAGADCTSIGESFAGPDMMNPDDYRRLAYPHEKRVIERVQQELGLPFHLHICGSAGPIMEDMMNTSAMVLEIDQDAEMKAAKAVSRGKCVLHGNIEPARCIFGVPDEVRELTRQVLEDGMEGGGLLCGPGCALGGPTPPENVHALCEAVREHGIYN
jgi:MtaA/CmuA family methyltransferase